MKLKAHYENKRVILVSALVILVLGSIFCLALVLFSEKINNTQAVETVYLNNF